MQRRVGFTKSDLSTVMLHKHISHLPLPLQRFPSVVSLIRPRDIKRRILRLPIHNPHRKAALWRLEAFDDLPDKAIERIVGVRRMIGHPNVMIPQNLHLIFAAYVGDIAMV